MKQTKYQTGGQIIVFVGLIFLGLALLTKSSFVGMLSVGTAGLGIPWLLYCENCYKKRCSE